MLSRGMVTGSSFPQRKGFPGDKRKEDGRVGAHAERDKGGESKNVGDRVSREERGRPSVFGASSALLLLLPLGIPTACGCWKDDRGGNLHPVTAVAFRSGGDEKKSPTATPMTSSTAQRPSEPACTVPSQAVSLLSLLKPEHGDPDSRADPRRPRRPNESKQHGVDQMSGLLRHCFKPRISGSVSTVFSNWEAPTATDSRLMCMQMMEL
ncbi:hypothetical protein EYF80_051207 [Liparis tanakae]|uniref:Uncharacterized protein n=1 Tax=Liparis tanakae TaxID=230148 RepID=A0A4Z2FBT6_9TELE|nr:hypothetical protein EYF80_051207 [Liparis tanakae]